MTRKQWIPAVLIFGMVMLISPPAHANVIIPVIVAGWFGMVLVLIPIILIEAAILMRIGAGMWESLLAMSTANIASTLAGLPLAIMLECKVAGPARLYDEDFDHERMLPVVGVLLLIPFFFLSWWIEAPIAMWFLDELPSQMVNLAVRNGNLATYSILAVMLVCILAWLDARAKANWFARREMGKLRLAEIEIANKSATDDHIEHREVQTEPQAQRTDKTGASDILHDESCEAETSLPVQTEDTDLAA